MTTYYSAGGLNESFSEERLADALQTALDALGPRRRVLALPPDFTRRHSQAGLLTCLLQRALGPALTDVMPALGTHVPMTAEQLNAMFPGLPHELVREHRWRTNVTTIGEVPAEFVRGATEGVYDKPWPAQLNRLVWEGGHDLIVSVGQVVPHEVIGMANYNKNLFVGAGGAEGINESHFIGAVYGMERMMGRADTPLRRILNEAQRLFCGHLPLLFVLTVVGADERGESVVRGLYIGDDAECFEQASALAVEVNFEILDEEPEKVVVYLDPEEFHTTWLGNKAVYRTRMAIADGGELVVLAPGVAAFGEDPEIDRLIRQHGYRTTGEVLRRVGESAELRANLSAAAHLIHGSSENRFRITYCPGRLSRQEIESVGYAYGDLAENLERYQPQNRRPGWNRLPGGETIFFVANPALGLWAARSRLTG